MNDRRRILVSSIFIMAGAVLCATAVAITILYRTAFDEQRGRLLEIATGQARFMEAVARFDAVHSRDALPDGAVAATLSQIADARQHHQGFGKTGELVIARREGDRIVFLFPYRHGDGGDPDPVPWASELAGPMRLALSGREGTTVSLDYRGEAVLASFTPVAILDSGVVAKIDLAEVRAPFVTAALSAGGVTVLLVLVGAGLTLRVTEPIVRQLQESEERLRLTIDAVSDGGWDWNVTTGEVRYSDRWLQSLGYKRDEVAPRISFWESIVHPDDLPSCLEALNAHLDGRTPHYESENRLRTASGEYRWSLDRGRVVARDDAGKPLRMVGTDTDITERKRAAEALRESARRFQLLYENAPLGYQSLDTNGMMLTVNRAWLDLLGYAQEEVHGRWFGDFLTPSSQDAFRERFPRFKEKGETRGSEFEMQCKDGSTITVAIDGQVSRDEEGRFKQTHCILHDITERKRAEVELASTMEELQQFDRLTVGREERMIELKHEVNELARKAGLAPPYDTALVEVGQGGPGDA